MSIKLGDKTIGGQSIYIPYWINDDRTYGPGVSGETFIPTAYERLEIVEMGVDIGAWTGADDSNFSRLLKIPPSGLLLPSLEYSLQGSRFFLWSCISEERGKPFSDCLTNPGTRYVKQGYGASVRLASWYVHATDWVDLYVNPNDSNNKIQYSESEKCINLMNEYYISSMNVGATVEWNYGDQLTDNNRGKYFQRGNNYGFTLADAIQHNSPVKVNTDGYGPSNFSSNVFITNDEWQVKVNRDLWGGGDVIPLELFGINVGDTEVFHGDFTNASNSKNDTKNNTTKRMSSGKSYSNTIFISKLNKNGNMKNSTM